MQSRRSFASLLPTVLVLSAAAPGCAAMDPPQDHTLEIRGVGQTVRDLSYEYGSVKRTRREIGAGGGSSVTQPMPVPETLTVRWTTADGKVHDVTVPIRSRVPAEMRNRTIKVEVDGPRIEVFLETPEPGGGHRPTRSQIYP